MEKIMSIKHNSLLVKDVQLNLTEFAVLPKNSLIKETLDKMNEFSLGIACIVDESNKLLGVLTDGDIRRKIVSNQKPLSALFVDDSLQHAITGFKYISEDNTLIEAVKLIEKYKIWDLPVVDSNLHLKGLFHLHPAVQSLLQE